MCIRDRAGTTDMAIVIEWQPTILQIVDTTAATVDVATVIQPQTPNPQYLNKPACTADVTTVIKSQPATPQFVTRRLVLLTFTPLSSRNLQLYRL